MDSNQPTHVRGRRGVDNLLLTSGAGGVDPMRERRRRSTGLSESTNLHYHHHHYLERVEASSSTYGLSGKIVLRGDGGGFRRRRCRPAGEAADFGSFLLGRRARPAKERMGSQLGGGGGSRRQSGHSSASCTQKLQSLPGRWRRGRLAGAEC